MAEFVDFLKSISPDIQVPGIVLNNTVTAADLERKVAFRIVEFWKSDGDKTSLRNQLDEFQKNGWRLIQVFEDELINSSEIVFSRCKHALGLTDVKIYARQTKVCQVDAKVARKFFLANHIQGNGRGANIFVGLMYKDQLVACVGVGKARFNPEAEYELIRFASKLGYSVVGGASKIMKYLSTIISGKIVSYADRRYSDGGVYRALGFVEKMKSAPCYWYFKTPDKKFHRSAFQKHKLERQLEIFDVSRTEIQNMKDNGWGRVFDSGNFVFMKTL